MIGIGIAFLLLLSVDSARAALVEAGSLTTVTVEAPLYDTRLSDAGGCDPAGCSGDKTRDGDTTSADSRWACQPALGTDDESCSITYGMADSHEIDSVSIALFLGDERQRTLDVYVDGALTSSWTSSGTTVDFESIDLFGTTGQDITITGVLADTEWLSIAETEIMVWTDDTVSPSPIPAATLHPSPDSIFSPTPAQQPTSDPVGDLQTVGLLPLAFGDGTDDELYTAKDGDLSTSWTCTGDPPEPAEDGGIPDYDCQLTISLVYYRQISQVKVALADGAVMELRLSGRLDSTVAEEFVTSSGTTDLETYDYGYLVSSIRIAPIFTSAGQTITISEVEFVEEIMDGEVLINYFGTPFGTDDGANEATTDGFEWTTDSDEAIDEDLWLQFAGYFAVTEMQLEFPVGDTYLFDLWIRTYTDDTGDSYMTVTDLESVDMAGWQSFDMTSYTTELVTRANIYIRGTGSGAPGFSLLNARFLGTQVDNPTGTYIVATTRINLWDGIGYPDFVSDGTGDQTSIMGAICAVKQATFDGVDCVGGDDTATGTVDLSFGAYYVDGNIFMKSGVYLEGRYTDDEPPFTTDIYLEDGAAGNTDVDAIIVMDGISNALVDDVWIRGLYDPDTSNAGAGVSGLGSNCVSVVGSTNITLFDIDIRNCDGDALVVSDSTIVNVDAGGYDVFYSPWTIGESRGTGLVVDASDSVWVRRHTFYDNGVAGLHITATNNFTFEATIGDGYEGSGNVGSLDGQQPIEVIIEDSSLVTFQDMRVQSTNDPVMTVSTSTAVSFTNTDLSSVEAGICVIQTDTLSEVTIDAEEDELVFEGSCYVKV